MGEKKKTRKALNCLENNLLDVHCNIHGVEQELAEAKEVMGRMAENILANTIMVGNVMKALDDLTRMIASSTMGASILSEVQELHCHMAEGFDNLGETLGDHMGALHTRTDCIVNTLNKHSGNDCKCSTKKK